MKYEVQLFLEAPRVATITVDADSEEDAEEIAYDQALCGEFEWEETEWSAEAITIENIEESENE